MSSLENATNPYRPGAAVKPVYLAGRAREMRRFSTTLRGAPQLPANIRLTGLRGVGKTVLLKEYERIANEELNWATSRIQIEPRHNTDVGIADLIVGVCTQSQLNISQRARIRAKAKGVTVAARSVVRVSFEQFEVSLAGPVEAGERSILRALFDATRAAESAGMSGFLLMLDEAQILRDEKSRHGDHPLSLLVAAINILQESELPIAIVLCGLPTLRSNLLRARTYSERMFRGEEIGSLTIDEAKEAFTRPLDGSTISVLASLTERVMSEVEGYPFFIQLWGAELWEAAHANGLTEFPTNLLKVVEPEIFRRLDTDFYDARLEALTPAEQDLLLSTAECSYPPLRTADIRNTSGKSDGNVNVLMGRLADQGVVFRIQKGQYEYTAPKFHAYLQRRAARPQYR